MFMIADKEYELSKGGVRLWLRSVLFIAIVVVKGLLITSAYFSTSAITLLWNLIFIYKSWLFFTKTNAASGLC